MKRYITLILVLALIVSMLSTGAVSSSGRIISYDDSEKLTGDADGDGEVTDWDAIMFDRYLAAWPAPVDLSVLDIDRDGEVSDWDAIILARYLAGWDIELDPEPVENRENVFDVWNDSVKPAIGTLKQTILEMTDEGLYVKDARNGSTSGSSGDPYVTLDVAKYSELAGKKEMTGADGSYIVFKLKSENTDGDFEVFTQTPAAGDSCKSTYVHTGMWQYTIVDMTNTTLVQQEKLSTIRIDWASTYIKPTGWMVISEIAFFADKEEAFTYANVPVDPDSCENMTDVVSMPSEGDTKPYLIYENGTVSFTAIDGVNAIEIIPATAGQKITLDLRALAALQGQYPSQKRYLAILIKTVDNAGCTVTFNNYADLTGKLVSVETKGDLTVSETGWQGMFFDLEHLRTDHASMMKITFRLSSLTRNTGRIYLGGVVVSDDINDVLEAVSLPQYKLNSADVSYSDPLAFSILEAPDEDDGISVWFDHPTQKVPKTVVEPTDLSGYTINMAKNESENAQYFVAPSKDMNVSITVDPFDDGNGNTIVPEITYEFYHNIAHEMIPDALLDLKAPISVAAGNSQAFMIRLTTTKDTPAGLYNSVIHVFDADTGKEIKRSPIAVKVYDFALTDETALRTSFALWPSYVSNSYPAGGDGYDSTEWNDVMKNYYEFFFKYRINIMDLPYGLTSSRGVAIMNDARVNTARWSVYDYSAWDDLVNDGYTEKPMWLSKIIYYPGEADEPRTEAHFVALKNAAEKAAAIDPDYRMVIPIERDLELTTAGAITNINKSDWDSVAFVMNYTNIYCPKLDAFTPRELSRRGGATFLQSVAQDNKYGVYYDRVREGVKKGGELWAYICINPTQPYCNWQIDNDGTEAIVSLWQMKQLGVTGMLYWAVDYWNVSYWRTSEPWEHNSKGDGMLIYSGHIQHSLYPVPTIRLELIRDGIEDYQMLTMLGDALGEEAMNDMVSKVCTSVVTYTNNDTYLRAARAQLYEALEAAYNG